MFRNLSPTALGVAGHQSEIIELALSFGFQSIDLDVGDFLTRSKSKGADYARRLFESAKLRLGVFALPVELDADDADYSKRLQKLPEYVQAAADAGCVRAVAALSPDHETRPYHENFELHRRRLAEICGVLRASNVTLGLGFKAAPYHRRGGALQFVHDLDATLLLINMVGAPNIGLALDLWELFAGGGSVEGIRKLKGEQVVAVDLADLPAGAAAAELTEDSRLLPAEAPNVDLAAALEALVAIGYKGPVTPKVSRAALQGLRRDAIVRAAGESLTRLWRAAGLTVPGRVPVAAS